jgi:hypothetical protein
MTAAFLRIDDQFARRAGTNGELLVERSHSRKRAGVPCAPQLGKWCEQHPGSHRARQGYMASLL